MCLLSSFGLHKLSNTATIYDLCTHRLNKLLSIISIKWTVRLQAHQKGDSSRQLQKYQTRKRSQFIKTCCLISSQSHNNPFQSHCYLNHSYWPCALYRLNSSKRERIIENSGRVTNCSRKKLHSSDKNSLMARDKSLKERFV